ncbi:hypothetical protein [Rhodoferax sp.]|uniref:hypothetical protein n=1 Tax=Rhodoferax sp. TaxID=50421 RepID=UPI0027308262|nr:hypothetical protein [Rhodoferax sp.]MDP2442393.1 hypothetical protein [Rhodoferax sp.]MDZ4209253.1 hypothetical protein [Rhodoferax sp.]
MSPFITAVLAFEDRLLTFETLLEAFDQVAGDQTSPWLVVMQDQIQALNQAFEPISTLSRGIERAALDLEALQGGIGVVDPDEAKRNGIKE